MFHGANLIIVMGKSEFKFRREFNEDQKDDT